MCLTRGLQDRPAVGASWWHAGETHTQSLFQHQAMCWSMLNGAKTQNTTHFLSNSTPLSQRHIYAVSLHLQKKHHPPTPPAPAPDPYESPALLHTAITWGCYITASKPYRTNLRTPLLHTVARQRLQRVCTLYSCTVKITNHYDSSAHSCTTEMTPRCDSLEYQSAATPYTCTIECCDSIYQYHRVLRLHIPVP